MPFRLETELVDYVESQVRQVLPVDWRLERLEGKRLGWRLALPSQDLTDYLLYVAADYTSLLFVHGNNDAGPLRLDQMLLNAKMIDVEALRLFSMSQMVEHLLKSCKPNQWGLT